MPHGDRTEYTRLHFIGGVPRLSYSLWEAGFIFQWLFLLVDTLHGRTDPGDRGPAASIRKNRRNRVMSHRFSYFAVLAGSILYFLPALRLVSYPADEGTLILGAARVVQGQVPYRDFFEVVG